MGLLEQKVWESLISLCKFILLRLIEYLVHHMVMSSVNQVYYFQLFF